MRTCALNGPHHSVVTQEPDLINMDFSMRTERELTKWSLQVSRGSKVGLPCHVEVLNLQLACYCAACQVLRPISTAASSWQRSRGS